MPALVRDNVRRTLFRMAFPMLAGTFAMNAYQLTDAWFISRLGTVPLAAMAFTFPVVMLLTFIAGGIGTGVTTLMSHALGRHDHDDAARLVTHGLTFTAAVTVVIAIVGYGTIGPLFSWLGADARTLPLVGDYMRIWYLGALTMFVPMMGNGLLISAGDSRSASRLMLAGAGLNALLNPVLIFGLLGVPAHGDPGFRPGHGHRPGPLGGVAAHVAASPAPAADLEASGLAGASRLGPADPLLRRPEHPEHGPHADGVGRDHLDRERLRYRHGRGLRRRRPHRDVRLRHPHGPGHVPDPLREPESRRANGRSAFARPRPWRCASPCPTACWWRSST